MSSMGGHRDHRPGGRRRAATRVLTGLAALLITMLLALLVIVSWLLLVPGHAVEAGKTVRVEIPTGASTAVIAERLVDAGVIGNAKMFRLRARLASADGKLRPGAYEFTTGSSYAAVLDRLLSGPRTAYITLSIPEGFVIEQIAERVEAELGIPADEFTALAKGGASKFAGEHPYLADAYTGSLEGYLFPKTYEIRRGATASEIIGMMLDQFDAEIGQVDQGYAKERGLSQAELVVLASMIEREAKLAEERPLVSSVIYNRLDIGMKLEIDATIEYVLPGNRFRLTARDLRLDSPYNTYRNSGLPPGPISNPGLASLQAAASPAPTTYLYYVLTGKDGSHTFCTTRAEFDVAKRKSKEVFGR